MKQTKNQILEHLANLLIPQSAETNEHVFDLICDALNVDIKYYDQLRKDQLLQALDIVERELATKDD